MYSVRYGLISAGRQDKEWGTFISPDPELATMADPNQKLNVYIPSGIKADFSPFIQRDPTFDQIVERVVSQRHVMSYEEQCSGKYYFDAFTILQTLKGKINRVAEVGIYLGGASCIFAGCVDPFNIELDLIEPKKEFLLYTYERIRRAFPEALPRVRLFYGDLPSYIKNVVQHENQNNILFHHDAGHNFNQVVNDLCAIYHVKEKAHGLMIQDTHLRSALVQNYVFVDAAVYSIFGFNLKYAEIGVKFSMSTEPAYRGQGYFIDNHPEGFYIPFDQNQFYYPHPSMKLENVDTMA